ncbi:A24 family peptidase [Paenalcaligenes niemegkensis]|uniref:prepilin peptidase n=1 Tax=Paenalcaligenes niemegkensis TaxID=2895469 RepID=UPI001EE92F4E|nr:A24 family peptidase [Paenalcaligenes niemegkensis]MCQ9616995.1 A24 family peptidase [Paenalcaligenes niemegkensis]
MAIFLTLALLFCAVSDFLQRKVRNVALVLIMAVVGSAYLLQSLGWFTPELYTSWSAGSLGFAVAFIASYIAWRFKIIGGGDVKLLAVLGFCFGLFALGPIVLIGTLLTGAHALVLYVLRRYQADFGFMIARLPASVPYGGWLAISAIGWMQWTISQ